MKRTMILTGDINLLGVTDPEIPFAQIAETMNAADVVFSNLECCFYEPDLERSVEDEGFYAPHVAAGALKLAGIDAIGNANNVNYGAPAIRSSLHRLDELGIPHTGAGLNSEDARRPVIIERNGLRFGFLQRTSVFWSLGHEATDDFPGVATVTAHTAFRPRVEELRALTRPGMPPEVVTWAEPDALARFQEDIADLRKKADIVVASNHWGLNKEVLRYQTEIGRAAIDAGADIVMGHGPHFPLAVEIYHEKPIFYGIGSFSFETGHRAQKHPDWIGLLVNVTLEDAEVVRVAFSFVRHNDRNETVPRPMTEEAAELEDLRAMSAEFGAEFTVAGDEAVVWQKD